MIFIYYVIVRFVLSNFRFFIQFYIYVTVDLDIGFKNLLKQDQSLHQKILLYEPVWLESLKSMLKENGVKCSLHELMNYLDEKVI